MLFIIHSTYEMWLYQVYDSSLAMGYKGASQYTFLFSCTE